MQGFNAHKRAHQFQRKQMDEPDSAGEGDHDDTKAAEEEEEGESGGGGGGGGGGGEEGAGEGGGCETKRKRRKKKKALSQTGQPSLNCRFCGRSCKTLRTLSNHENIHTSGISKNSYKYFMEVKEEEFFRFMRFHVWRR